MKNSTKYVIAAAAVIGGTIVAYSLTRVYIEQKDRDSVINDAISYAKTQNGRVLNIACGKTPLTSPSKIYDNVVNMDIVDQSTYMPLFELGDIYNINYPDKYFSSVISSHTLEHLERPEDAIKELHRVGDKVWIVVPQFALQITEFPSITGHIWIYKHGGVWYPNEDHIAFAGQRTRVRLF